MKKLYGLIGYPLSHSFSGKYFKEKFLREGITGCSYELFEIDRIEKVDDVFAREGLCGFNVTIPYKHDIKAYMDHFDHSASKVGAMNVVKINADGSRTGYNSDYYGFRTSIENWLPKDFSSGAIVLGIGGAAQAVMAVLEDMAIPFVKVSRDRSKGDMDYRELHNNPVTLQNHKLIINTTPLGMAPKTDAMPDLEYHRLGNDYWLYDLIYNPAETKFMSQGARYGAKVKNGYEMLELQAEKSWEIWNS